MFLENQKNLNQSILKLNRAYKKIKSNKTETIISDMVKRDKKSYLTKDFYNNNINLIYIDCIARYMIKYTDYLDNDLNYIKDSEAYNNNDKSNNK